MNIISKVDKRSIILASLGNIFEWFDFAIYGNFSFVIGKLFFSDKNYSSSLTAVFSVFAIGFLTRLIGGIVLGYFADKFGRKKSLLSSVFFMTVPSFCIALLPTSQQFIFFSTFLLLACRLLQGLSVGGEFPVMICYLFEKSPPEHRGFYTSIANMTTTLGVLLGFFVALFIQFYFSQKQIAQYAWRIPFLISAALTLFCFYLRKKLTEPEIFLEYLQNVKKKINRIHFFENDFWQMTKLFGLLICVAIAYYSFNVFSTTYLNYLGYGSTEALCVSGAGTTTLVILIPLFGYLSDQIEKNKILYAALIGIIFLIIPTYHLFLYHKLIYAVVAQVLFGFLLAPLLAAYPAILVEISPFAFRCLRIAIPYNLCLVIFGGTAPMINMNLLHYFHNNMAPAYYITIAAVISLISLNLLKIGRGGK